MLLIALPHRLLMVSISGKNKMFCLSFVFFTLEQTTKIKICHMVATEHPELIEGRRRLIATDVIDYEESVEYGLIDNSGSDQDE